MEWKFPNAYNFSQKIVHATVCKRLLVRFKQGNKMRTLIPQNMEKYLFQAGDVMSLVKKWGGGLQDRDAQFLQVSSLADSCRDRLRLGEELTTSHSTEPGGRAAGVLKGHLSFVQVSILLHEASCFSGCSLHPSSGDDSCLI